MKMTKKVSALLFGAVLAVGTGIVTTWGNPLPTPAYAATTTVTTASQRDGQVAAGEYGTVNWYLTANGELHLGAGTLGEDSNLGPLVGRLAAQIAAAQGVTDLTDTQVQPVADQVTKVVLDGQVVAPTDSTELFGQFRHVAAYEHLDRLNTSHVTKMESMFRASNLDSETPAIDVSHFDTSHVTDMNFMFYGQKSVGKLDVSGFNTDQVTNMLSAFYGTQNLNEVNFAQGTFKSLKGAGFMFATSAVQIVKLPRFAPPAGWGGGNMFSSATIINELTLGPDTRFDKADGSGGATGLNTPRQNMPDVFTGLWQAVGKGTVGDPLGDEYATGKEITDLYNGTSNPSAVETYVWQPVVRTTEPTTPPVTPPTTVPETAAPVTVQYLDAQGQRLADDVTLTGELGASYTAQPLTFTGYKLAKTTGTTTGSFTNQPQTVTFHYVSSLVSGGDAATVAPINAVVYATKKIGLYRTKNFSNQSRVQWYTKTKRVDRPMFVVTGFATSKNGNLRYKVRDVNHHSKTVGKTGYITAKKSYVTSVYYATKQSKIKVINAQGINAYGQKSLKTKQVHYRKGQTLKVRKIVKYHKTTRFQLTNGQYVTANKKLVMAE